MMHSLHYSVIDINHKSFQIKTQILRNSPVAMLWAELAKCSKDKSLSQFLAGSTISSAGSVVW